MSKLKVKGNAEMEFEAELEKIVITFHTREKTSGEAIAKGKEEIEGFLSQVNDELGIKPESFEMGNDSVSQEEDDDDKVYFEYEKVIKITFELSSQATEQIKSILANFRCIEYGIDYLFKDRAEKESQVLKAAIMNSKKRAELLAEALGQKITGSEEVLFSDYGSSGDWMWMAQERCIVSNYKTGAPGFASRLSNPKENISKTVEVTWLTE